VEAGNDDERADGVGQVVEEKTDVLVGISGAVDSEKTRAISKNLWTCREDLAGTADNPDNQDDGGTTSNKTSRLITRS